MTKWLLIYFLITVVPLPVHAENHPAQTITPHEERCPMCGAYGYCKEQPTHEEAVNVLKSHYAKKGMQVVITKQDGRFIEAEVIKNKKMIDRILLDCKTGRIRSI